MINPLNNANGTSAPSPLSYDYVLNINTLSGDTFNIELLRRSRGDELIEYMSTERGIRNIISSHYTCKRLDKCIEDNHILMPKDHWKYGTKDDGYLCGATEYVINEIKRYNPEHQKLIHNNTIVSQVGIINGSVRLNDNDCITVVFTS